MPPTSNELPGSTHPHESEYSDNYQTPPTNPGPPQQNVPELAYPPQPPYYAPYSQPAAQQSMISVPYSYQPYSPVSGPSTAQLTEGSDPTSSYVGNYGSQSQPALSTHQGESHYYSQPTPSPTSSTATEGTYGHQYMPFRQTYIGLPYPETDQPSSPQLSIVPEVSQTLVPSNQAVDEYRVRGEEVNYGSVASSYRHIITTVSQVPSPTTDSPGQLFEQPVVDDMLHRAVEGLRYLDPIRADQHVYPGEFGAQPVASGAVAPESPSETVFVQYYEDGRSEVNPVKKKKRERKGATQCASCHAISTPEWRRGPLGPRTLCNACGLVYAKLMKRRMVKEEEKLSPVGSPRRARSKGKSRELVEETEEDREQGSDDTLPPVAGPSRTSGGGYPP